jgi:uncharacterized protein
MPAILWQRLDRPGHEVAVLRRETSGWLLSGSAVFEHERQPCRVDYRVFCDPQWITLSAAVSGFVGDRDVDVTIRRRDDGTWTLDGRSCPRVDGCIDVDLNFSPSTNLLPIRRLGLRDGEQSTVRAAWLRFPSFTLEPLEQTYRRLDEKTYRYENAGGSFVADLLVSEAGFPIRYGDIWTADAVL